MRTLLPPSSWVDHYVRWLDASATATLLESLMASLLFEQRSVTLFGRLVPQPRLIAWCGEAPYTYSGLTLPPRPVPDCLTPILRDVSRAVDVTFNHVLLNLYRTGDDGMGKHSDDELELGADPVVATLSLGARRRFVLNAREGDHCAQFDLDDGSLLVMGGRCQSEYVHGVPKTRKPVGPRLSLTFRRIGSRPR